MITYKDHADITVDQAIDLYVRSTLGERRPINHPETFEAMLKHANLTVSAWDARAGHVDFARHHLHWISPGTRSSFGFAATLPASTRR